MEKVIGKVWLKKLLKFYFKDIWYVYIYVFEILIDEKEMEIVFV